MRQKTATLAFISIGLGLLHASAWADDKPVRIGVLTDMSSVYSDASGKGSLESAMLAAEDAGLILGHKKLNC